MLPTCPESSLQATSSVTTRRAGTLSTRYGVCPAEWPGLLLRGCPQKAPLPVYPLLAFAFLRAKDPDGLWVSP